MISASLECVDVSKVDGVYRVVLAGSSGRFEFSTLSDSAARGFVVGRWYPVAVHLPASQRLAFRVGPVAEQFEIGPFQEGIVMILTDSQKVSLSITPKNKKGNPAPLDGVPQWASSNPDAVSVTPSADGLSCVCAAVNAGTAQVSVTADADLGEGVTPLAGTIDFDVRPGPAVSLGIVAGTPEEQ